MSSASPLMGDKNAVVPEGEHEATPTGVTESRRDEETPGTGEEGVVVAGKEGTVTVETDEEEDNLTKEVKFPDDLSDGSEKEEGEIDEEEEEDLKKSSSPQQPPESIEPALQGDPFIKPKSRHAAVANASQRGVPVGDDYRKVKELLMFGDSSSKDSNFCSIWFGRVTQWAMEKLIE
ncbi:hypothetical protein EMCRGX_G016159 [Ephydatia muelleri]